MPTLTKSQPALATRADWETLKGFTSPGQYAAIVQFSKGEEGDWFKARVAALANTIRTAPAIGATDGMGDSAPVVLHYFIGGADWWVSEIDQSSGEMFGLADLFQDGGELGYIDRFELLACNAELDLHWNPENTRAKARAGR